MSTRQYVVFFGLILVTEVMVTSRVILGQEARPTPGQGNTIQVTARKYRFDPAVITVKQGDRVKLIITAVDHDHGFKLAAYDIDQKLPKGVATPVEFTADKAGTFSFHCSHFCGIGHPKMKGKLVVEAASASSSGPTPSP